MFTFNAEHFYFLHDLISSYVKAKDRGKPPVGFSPHSHAFISSAVNTDDRSRTRTTETPFTDPPVPLPLEETQSSDTRRFHCPDAKWRLQPTIKLLTAYGKEVEPFGADYILQKLGFRHARLTIPKSLQRGVMDPCEQSMTVVQLILISLLPEHFKQRCLNTK